MQSTHSLARMLNSSRDESQLGLEIAEGTSQPLDCSASWRLGMTESSPGRATEAGPDFSPRSQTSNAYGTSIDSARHETGYKPVSGWYWAFLKTISPQDADNMSPSTRGQRRVPGLASFSTYNRDRDQ